MRCDTPKKQFGGPKRSSVSGAVISIHALGDSIYAIHSDFTVCTYKLYHARGAAPFHFKVDRARVLESNEASISNLAGPPADEINQSNKPFDDTKQPQRSNVSFAIALGTNISRSVGNGNSSSDPSHLLMSCGYFDNCVKVHSLDSLQLQNSLNGGHRGSINCLEVGEEGEVLVTGGDDATCHIWIVDHESLALAITDGYVKSSLGTEGFEESNCYHVHTLLGHVTPVNCVSMCTKLDVVISGSEGGSICIHNIRSGKFVRSLHIDATTKEVLESCGGNGIPVKKLAIHIDGYFVAHLCDGSLWVISINGQQLCRAHIGEHLNAMIICSKSNSIVTGGSMGCVRIWKLDDLSLQCTIDVKKHGSITSLAFTPDKQFLCIGSVAGLISIVSTIPE